MGTPVGVTLRAAELLDRPMREREVDLSSRSASIRRVQAQLLEQALGHAVMATILRQAGRAFGGKPGLPSVSNDEASFFERG